MAKTFRRDVDICHDGRTLMLTSKGLAGRDCNCQEGSTTWKRLIDEGIFLPITLFSKVGGTQVRVLLNKKMNRQEEEEWFDHFAWKLQIPDGTFALVGGGYDYLMGNDRETGVEFLTVPPDTYRIDVYTCFAGVNGPATMESPARQPKTKEPFGQWFRRTRPRKEMPEWLEYLCFMNPSQFDPDNEEEYEEEPDEDDEYIDFIIQLTSMSLAEPLPLKPPKLVRGIIPLSVNPRWPEKCPLGLLLSEE